MSLAGRFDALRQHPGVRVVVANLGWLTGDKIVRLGLGLFIGVAVARHLGPAQFGLFNYALSIVVLLGAPALLGLDSLLVREIVQRPERAGALLGSAVAARAGAAALLWLGLSAVALTEVPEPVVRALLIVLGLQLFSAPLNTVMAWFQSRLQSRETVLATNAASLAAAALRIGLIVAGAGVLPFAWVYLVEVLGASLLLIRAYRQGGERLSSWRFDRVLLQDLLRQSWPLILSSGAMTLYMRADQILLGQLLSKEAVGTYAAAVRVSEIWSFIPAMIATALFPSIVRTRTLDPALYAERRQSYFDLSAVIAYTVALPVSLASWLIIRVLYGVDFLGAAPVLALHIWGLVFVFMGIAREQYLINEGRVLFSLGATIAGAIVNIGLNLLLIPRLGVVGPAVATLVAYAVSALLSSFFVGEVRPLGWAALSALNPFGSVRRLLRADRSIFRPAASE